MQYSALHGPVPDRIPSRQPRWRANFESDGPFTLNAVFDFQTIARAEQANLTLIDLTEVPYMDSAALGSLLGFHVSCERDGHQYALVGVSERLKTLFKVAGADGLLNTSATLEDAASA